MNTTFTAFIVFRCLVAAVLLGRTDGIKLALGLVSTSPRFGIAGELSKELL